MGDLAPRVDDPQGIAALRAVLDAAGYSAERIERELELEGPYERSVADEPLYLRLLPAGEAFSTLVALFLLGVPVSREDAERALAPLPLERVERMGLLTEDGDRVRAVVEISPTEDFLLACDQGRMHADRPDHVLGYSAPTRVLATLTVLEPVGRALDVGTGSGYQALQAAGAAREVIGVDVNPRALEFARFNAHLNRVSNVELREGSLFEPVHGERFGLVVCNPPYVISPETEYVFRDSGLPGDSFCEALVRALPGHLEEGAYGIALLAWVHGRDEEPSAPVRRWVDGSGCDAVLLRYASTEPLRYAATWNRALAGDPPAYARALERWTAYYRTLGIETIGWGGLVLRRRAAGAPNWFWTHDPSSNRVGAAGHHVLRLFAAQDFLGADGDGAPGLLDARLALSDDHAVDQALRLGSNGRHDLGPLVLRLTGGLCFRVELDLAAVNVLSRLDGTRTVREALAETAGDPDTLAGAALPGIRRLVELGFLLPVGAAR
jgi:methylase of polypeptide subunit release factors